MGSPNYLIYPLGCQHCGSQCRNPLQFNYGVLSDRDYVVGDEIDWNGPSNCGEPGLRSVVVAGEGYYCPVCGKLPLGEGSSPVLYSIRIQNDRIVGADLSQDLTVFRNCDWLVLER